MIVAVVYPFVADATARPLAGFVLPCLVTAVLGGWRPTLLVGITSFSVAIVVGLLGRRWGCGAPPVLLEHPVRVLDLPPTPPLGLGLNDNWTAIEVPWVRQPMLLYTDGLVENPDRQGEPRRWVGSVCSPGSTLTRTPPP